MPDQAIIFTLCERGGDMKKLCLCLMILFFACKENTNIKGKDTSKETVEVSFHVMSQCPFGVQVENAIKPVLDKLGQYVDFKLNFIGDEPVPGKLTSMHGENEVKGDIIQLCTKKYAPDKFMDVIVCMNRNMKEIPSNFASCASELGIDPTKINSCAEGDEGRKLLSQSFKISKAKRATGSPTIFIGGEQYEGGRTEADFMRAICLKYKKDKPEPCRSIPEPAKVDLIVLSDTRCKECLVDRFLGRFKSAFPGLTEPKIIDYQTDQGKELYDKIKEKGIRYLPAFIFSESVATEPAWSQYQSSAKDVEKYKVVTMGARFDPTAEICDNQIDDDKDSFIDCADNECLETMACRKHVPNKLEVFVMSECPFGIRALNSMKEVLSAFENKIDFVIHFIGDEEQQGELTSMHGQSEVAEDLREICAQHYYKKDYKFMDYIWCRNEDIKSEDWKKCATGGISAEVIEKCSTGDEGKKLLSQDFKVARGLSIGASPTWMVNNRFRFSASTPEQIKQFFCAYNKGAKGCEKRLSNEAKGPQGGCGAN